MTDTRAPKLRWEGPFGTVNRWTGYNGAEVVAYVWRDSAFSGAWMWSVRPNVSDANSIETAQLAAEAAWGEWRAIAGLKPAAAQ